LGVACLNTCNACATRGAIGASDIKTNKNKWIDIFVWRRVAARFAGFDGKPSTLVEAADSRQGGKGVMAAKGAKERQGKPKDKICPRMARMNANQRLGLIGAIFGSRFSLRVPSRPSR
jgi:hypothetical protein